MCKKTNYKDCNVRIDKCMREAIETLHQGLENHLKVIASCCGHEKYPMTIVLKNTSTKIIFELFSGRIIPRKRNFYKKDKEGYYYIPEVVNGR